MKHKPGVEKSPCKVISFKNFKDKKVNKVTSTIAAIIAIKIEHSSDKLYKKLVDLMDKKTKIKNTEVIKTDSDENEIIILDEDNE